MIVYRKYTQEEIDSVAQTDMVDFLSSEYGYHFYKKGNRFFCVERPNLSIGTNKLLWYLKDEKIGGCGILTWMQKIEKQGFPSAMEKLLGTSFAHAVLVEDPSKRYTKEQIEEVKQTDMVDFLSSEYGFHFQKKRQWIFV